MFKSPLVRTATGARFWPMGLYFYDGFDNLELGFEQADFEPLSVNPTRATTLSLMERPDGIGKWFASHETLIYEVE